MILSLACLVGVTVGLLILLDRTHARAAADRAAHRAQVAELLQRIQAPAEAVTEHAIRTSPAPAVQQPRFDDDEGYWQARGEITREELADALMVHESAGGS